jgi:serine/threonine protein kinase
MLRYIPPETLKQGIFSHKSDVWAYGCTLFEIWHYPYEEPYLEVQDNHALRKAILYDG